MNKIVKQIEELKTQISYIEFKDHLSSSDYAYLDQLKNEIEELEKQVKGLEGIVVKVSYKDKAHHISDGWYLTDNVSLCCSDEPTLFESLEEAQVQVEQADFDKENYNIEFVPTTL